MNPYFVKHELRTKETHKADKKKTVPHNETLPTFASFLSFFPFIFLLFAFQKVNLILKIPHEPKNKSIFKHHFNLSTKSKQGKQGPS